MHGVEVPVVRMQVGRSKVALGSFAKLLIQPIREDRDVTMPGSNFRQQHEEVQEEEGIRFGTTSSTASDGDGWCRSLTGLE